MIQADANVYCQRLFRRWIGVLKKHVKRHTTTPLLWSSAIIFQKLLFNSVITTMVETPPHPPPPPAFIFARILFPIPHPHPFYTPLTQAMARTPPYWTNKKCRPFSVVFLPSSSRFWRSLSRLPRSTGTLKWLFLKKLKPCVWSFVCFGQHLSSRDKLSALVESWR